MTSIAQIIRELVDRGEQALAEELTEILHPSQEDIEMILSQDEDKDKDDKGDEEEIPPADPAPMIPDEEGVGVRIDYAGRKYVIFVTIDNNVLYWSADKKLWVDDERHATRYDTKKKAEKATKRADKSFEKTYEGKEEPKAPAPPVAPEKAPDEPEEAPEEEAEEKPKSKKPVPPQFQKKEKKKDEDEEAKAQLIAHLREAGYFELAGAIAGDLSQKK